MRTLPLSIIAILAAMTTQPLAAQEQTPSFAPPPPPGPFHALPMSEARPQNAAPVLQPPRPPIATTPPEAPMPAQARQPRVVMPAPAGAQPEGALPWWLRAGAPDVPARPQTPQTPQTPQPPQPPLPQPPAPAPRQPSGQAFGTGLTPGYHPGAAPVAPQPSAPQPRAPQPAPKPAPQPKASARATGSTQPYLPVPYWSQPVQGGASAWPAQPSQPPASGARPAQPAQANPYGYVPVQPWQPMMPYVPGMPYTLAPAWPGYGWQSASPMARQ